MLRQFRRFAGQTEGMVQVVEVIASSSGIVTVQSVAGQQWTVYGEGLIAGQNAIIQGNQVISSIPAMPIYQIEVG